MIRNQRRLAGLAPLTAIAVFFPAVWLTATASAEERKLAVLLAYPIKQDAGAQGQAGLPNTNNIFDAYFDTEKDGQIGPDGQPVGRVDSHSEWWEEISYGDVTVSGNVWGWVNLPWRTLPENPGDLGPAAVPVGRISHVDLLGSPATYTPGVGESFSNFTSKFRYDFDGVGGNGRNNNFNNETGPNADNADPRIQPEGSQARDRYGNLVFTPGERFLDLNGNRVYDAGVFEWGIDKNGNGEIDVDKEAASWAELVGAVVQQAREESGEPLIDDPDCPQGETCPQIPNPEYEPQLELAFIGWYTDAEWFDSNGDGKWNADGRIPDEPDAYAKMESWPSLDGVANPGETPPISDPSDFPADPDDPNDEPGPEFEGTPTPMDVFFYRGDWGGTEIAIDQNGDFDIDGAATQNDEYLPPRPGAPADVFEFVLGAFVFGEQSSVEYYDEQLNDNYDFPEPFEDHLRRWDAGAHQFIRTSDEYIRANYPGNDDAMLKLLGDANNDVLGRIGNGRYDAPDTWSNRGQVNSSNKLQEVSGEAQNGEEASERNFRFSLSTLPPETFNDPPFRPSTGPAGWSLTEFWEEYFGLWAPPPPPTMPGDPPAPDPVPGPPDWDPTIPYFRKFSPTTPVINLAGDDEDRRFAFSATHGGRFAWDSFERGRRPDGGRYNETDGTVLPNIGDGRDGFYDGPAEYMDLPSSIYHSGGDGMLGEITSPASDSFFGQDLGAHDPGQGSGSGDTIIPAAGPLAFNVHGDQGWDAGNQLNTELLTWRTDGTFPTDIMTEILPPQDANNDGVPDDLNGDMIPDPFGLVDVQYHRDINLDGLIDLGETIGVPGEFGLPDRTVLHNYGMSPIAGQPANGDPSNFYPFSRVRAMEDTVAALDDVVDWDDFLGGAGPFGDAVYGLILLPEGTGPNGMFTLPASVGPGGFTIRTRDRQDPNMTGINRYVPISFFDGMGIELGGLGEGGGLSATSFQNGFAGHEYGHIWEGWPDLYDYDVRATPPLNIVNNPIGAWCVMANGGLVHPVPILKVDSGWLDPVDITRAVRPGLADEVIIRPWEFNRNKTVFNYTNPLFPGEQYWYWVTSPNKPNARAVNFDLAGPPADPTHGLPGLGLMIMRSDLGTNPEALPPQQRIAQGRFTYQIIQADGLQDLENGSDIGDAGDPFPGASNKLSFTRNTDPSSRWGEGEPTGIDFENITALPDGSVRVRVRWSPRELPTLAWVQPPPLGQPGEGAVSVNGAYTLITNAFDQFGGTILEFHAEPVIAGEPAGQNYSDMFSPVNRMKFPGDQTLNTSFNVGGLPDGTYTFYARLLPGPGSDGRIESEFSAPRASIDNIGDGVLEVIDVDLDVSRLQTWTATCVVDQPAGAEKWEVRGSSSGLQPNQAVTGQNYTSATGGVQFRIETRVLPFRVGDEFIFVTTGLTPHSSAVLVDDGEVVPPEQPEAAGRVAAGGTSGLAPLSVTFKHDGSSDPLDAALTFTWDFGDGTEPVTTDDLNANVTHTYLTPRGQPYQATLTVTNIFGLSDTFVIPITVNSAEPPQVRALATPVSGDVPLTVEFDASGTVDRNAGTQRIDFVWDFGDGSPISTLIAPTHTYDESGIFVATVTATNRPFNVSASLQIEIRVGGSVDSNLPPVAIIDATRTFGSAPLVVNFNADQSFDPEGDTLDFAWDFGDGSPIVRGASDVEHRFTKVGTFNTVLTVRDTLGQADTSTIAVTVTGDPLANNQAPLARISVSSRQGAAPFAVTFNASDSRDPEGGDLTYTWNFGDGTAAAEGMVVNHTYDKPQSYTAVLTVTDAQGASGAASVNILVNAAAGQQNPGDGDGGQDIPGQDLVGCAPGCGPAGFMPMAFMLLGVSGMRRLVVRRR